MMVIWELHDEMSVKEQRICIRTKPAVLIESVWDNIKESGQSGLRGLIGLGDEANSVKVVKAAVVSKPLCLSLAIYEDAGEKTEKWMDLQKNSVKVWKKPITFVESLDDGRLGFGYLEGFLNQIVIRTKPIVNLLIVNSSEFIINPKSLLKQGTQVISSELKSKPLMNPESIISEIEYIDSSGKLVPKVRHQVHLKSRVLINPLELVGLVYSEQSQSLIPTSFTYEPNRKPILLIESLSDIQALESSSIEFFNQNGTTSQSSRTKSNYTRNSIIISAKPLLLPSSLHQFDDLSPESISQIENDSMNPKQKRQNSIETFTLKQKPAVFSESLNVTDDKSLPSSPKQASEIKSILDSIQTISSKPAILPECINLDNCERTTQVIQDLADKVTRSSLSITSKPLVCALGLSSSQLAQEVQSISITLRSKPRVPADSLSLVMSQSSQGTLDDSRSNQVSVQITTIPQKPLIPALVLNDLMSVYPITEHLTLKSLPVIMPESIGDSKCLEYESKSRRIIKVLNKPLIDAWNIYEPLVFSISSTFKPVLQINEINDKSSIAPGLKQSNSNRSVIETRIKSKPITCPESVSDDWYWEETVEESLEVLKNSGQSKENARELKLRNRTITWMDAVRKPVLHVESIYSFISETVTCKIESKPILYCEALGSAYDLDAGSLGKDHWEKRTVEIRQKPLVLLEGIEDLKCLRVGLKQKIISLPEELAAIRGITKPDRAKKQLRSGNARRKQVAVFSLLQKPRPEFFQLTYSEIANAKLNNLFHICKLKAKGLLDKWKSQIRNPKRNSKPLLEPASLTRTSFTLHATSRPSLPAKHFKQFSLIKSSSSQPLSITILKSSPKPAPDLLTLSPPTTTTSLKARQKPLISLTSIAKHKKTSTQTNLRKKPQVRPEELQDEPQVVRLSACVQSKPLVFIHELAEARIVRLQMQKKIMVHPQDMNYTAENLLKKQQEKLKRLKARLAPHPDSVVDQKYLQKLVSVQTSLNFLRVLGKSSLMPRFFQWKFARAPTVPVMVSVALRSKPALNPEQLNQVFELREDFRAQAKPTVFVEVIERPLRLEVRLKAKPVTYPELIESTQVKSVKVGLRSKPWIYPEEIEFKVMQKMKKKALRSAAPSRKTHKNFELVVKPSVQLEFISFSNIGKEHLRHLSHILRRNLSETWNKWKFLMKKDRKPVQALAKPLVQLVELVKRKTGFEVFEDRRTAVRCVPKFKSFGILSGKQVQPIGIVELKPLAKPVCELSEIVSQAKVAKDQKLRIRSLAVKEKVLVNPLCLSEDISKVSSLNAVSKPIVSILIDNQSRSITFKLGRKPVVHAKSLAQPLITAIDIRKKPLVRIETLFKSQVTEFKIKAKPVVPLECIKLPKVLRVQITKKPIVYAKSLIESQVSSIKLSQKPLLACESLAETFIQSFIPILKPSIQIAQKSKSVNTVLAARFKPVLSLQSESKPSASSSSSIKLLSKPLVPSSSLSQTEVKSFAVQIKPAVFIKIQRKTRQTVFERLCKPLAGLELVTQSKIITVSLARKPVVKPLAEFETHKMKFEYQTKPVCFVDYLNESKLVSVALRAKPLLPADEISQVFRFEFRTDAKPTVPVENLFKENAKVVQEFKVLREKPICFVQSLSERKIVSVGLRAKPLLAAKEISQVVKFEFAGFAKPTVPVGNVSKDQVLIVQRFEVLREKPICFVQSLTERKIVSLALRAKPLLAAGEISQVVKFEFVSDVKPTVPIVSVSKDQVLIVQRFEVLREKPICFVHSLSQRKIVSLALRVKPLVAADEVLQVFKFELGVCAKPVVLAEVRVKNEVLNVQKLKVLRKPVLTLESARGDVVEGVRKFEVLVKPVVGLDACLMALIKSISLSRKPTVQPSILQSTVTTTTTIQTKPVIPLNCQSELKLQSLQIRQKPLLLTEELSKSLSTLKSQKQALRSAGPPRRPKQHLSFIPLLKPLYSLEFISKGQICRDQLNLLSRKFKENLRSLLNKWRRSPQSLSQLQIEPIKAQVDLLQLTRSFYSLEPLINVQTRAQFISKPSLFKSFEVIGSSLRPSVHVFKLEGQVKTCSDLEVIHKKVKVTVVKVALLAKSIVYPEELVENKPIKARLRGVLNVFKSKLTKCVLVWKTEIIRKGPKAHRVVYKPTVGIELHVVTERVAFEPLAVERMMCRFVHQEATYKSFNCLLREHRPAVTFDHSLELNRVLKMQSLIRGFLARSRMKLVHKLKGAIFPLTYLFKYLSEKECIRPAWASLKAELPEIRSPSPVTRKSFLESVLDMSLRSISPARSPSPKPRRSKTNKLERRKKKKLIEKYMINLRVLLPVLNNVFRKNYRLAFARLQTLIPKYLKRRYYNIQKGMKAIIQVCLTNPKSYAVEIMKYALYAKTYTRKTEFMNFKPEFVQFLPEIIQIQKFVRGHLARKRTKDLMQEEKRKKDKKRRSRTVTKSRVVKMRNVLLKVFLKVEKDAWIGMLKATGKLRVSVYSMQKASKKLLGLITTKLRKAFIKYKSVTN